MKNELKSWKCDNCTNIVYKEFNGELHKYCKPGLMGTRILKWIGNTVYCLNKENNNHKYYDITLEL